METTHHLAALMVVASKITHWLQHFLWVAWLVIFAAAAVFIASALVYRSAPFAVLPHEPIPVRAGSLARINVPVWRDLDRHCDAQMNRNFFDSENSRHEDIKNAYYTDAFIREQEMITPGRLVISIRVPEIKSKINPGGIAPGPAALVAWIGYGCTKGQRYLWPIQVRTEVSLIIVSDVP